MLCGLLLFALSLVGTLAAVSEAGFQFWTLAATGKRHKAAPIAAAQEGKGSHVEERSQGKLTPMPTPRPAPRPTARPSRIPAATAPTNCTSGPAPDIEQCTLCLACTDADGAIPPADAPKGGCGGAPSAGDENPSGHNDRQVLGAGPLTSADRRNSLPYMCPCAV